MVSRPWWKQSRLASLRVSAVEHFAKSDKQDKLIAECDGDIVAAVKKLPLPKKVAKPKTPDQERKDRKQAVDDLKHAWSVEWNYWQRRYFVKMLKDDIIAILKDIEEWQGEIDKGAAPSPKDGLDIPPALQRTPAQTSDPVPTAGIVGIRRVLTPQPQPQKPV
jgi:hypothetical protein